MPVTLAVHFPWKRYHATPWGHYVNEGLVELPPSPWRILRALYSVWKLRAPDLDADVVHGLLTQLAVPPDYFLPPYQVAHSRHYLPSTKHRTGAADTNLGLDTFASLGGDATIHVQWPGDLNAEQTEVLAKLAASLPYLGRADSICAASLAPSGWAPTPDLAPATPLISDELAPEMERVPLLAPRLPLDVDALITDTTSVRKSRLVYPPGSELVEYAVPPPAASRPRRPAATTPMRDRASTVTTRTALTLARGDRNANVTTVRFALHGKPLPRVADTVIVTDLLRAASLKALDQVAGPRTRPSNLVGRDENDQPLTGHQHAHYLALNHRDTIDELLIWAPGGLTDQELAALNQLANTTLGVSPKVNGPRDLHVRITAYGNDSTLPDDLAASSTSWTTRTPVLLQRWAPARTPADTHLVNEIHRELAHRDITTPVTITVLPAHDWIRYRRHRPTRQQPRNHRPLYGLRLDFTAPVTGPLRLGANTHFGLGLFQPAPP
ncbi:type I-U CRISPR-associated protein Csb2 [Actinomadura rayongensis]|uniref:Type I-U CRISPR-associated protein Cas5/Cas6 n=1 Tax=Actinomadura rayongensis TaxID=1429076 RepID=A0A6I4W5Y3_9ACTN|nr:type I-U CRISPR-associated protein Csb2 [Actinomadura rayongensis]MXQ64928.1 type I-U CRISPR-associated protein Cas5/Cas6 [Actinomadura rayongensis]